MPSLPGPILLDVGRWHLYEGFGESPLAKSGMLGATSSRRTGYTYTWECDLILDLRIQAELSLRTIRGAAGYFQLGSVVAYNAENIANPTDESPYVGAIASRFYWCPAIKVEAVSPIVDAGNRRYVRQHLAGTSSAHFLLLPEFGDDTGIGNTVAGAYSTFIANNPWF